MKTNGITNVHLAVYSLVPTNGDGSIDVRVRAINVADPVEINLKEIGGIPVFVEIPVKSSREALEVRVVR